MQNFGNVLPAFHYLIDQRLGDINIQDDIILSLIRNIDLSKSNGPDMISGHMITLFLH